MAVNPGWGGQKFIEASRPTDLDVDGSGRLYVSSWHGATFTYNGPNAGFVARLTPPNWELKPFMELAKASDEELLQRERGGQRDDRGPHGEQQQHRRDEPRPQ